jgi:hypothetical protein
MLARLTQCCGICQPSGGVRGYGGEGGRCAKVEFAVMRGKIYGVFMRIVSG